MILSDKDIKRYVEEGKIVIRPQPQWGKALGSCSLDLRLGSNANINLKQKTKNSKPHPKFQKLTLNPGEFCLGITLEYLELPEDLCGMLHGRSSLGRKGLMIHSTAPLIDAGFRGRIVLELYNAGSQPIVLKTGQRICAVSFEKLTTPADVPYYKKKGAKYVGQKDMQINSC